MMPKHSFRAPWARILSATVAASLLAVTACSSDSGGTPGGSSVAVVEIVTLPNNQTLVDLIPGNTRQLLGVPTNSADNFVKKAVTWASSMPTVATITADGLVTAVAGGTTVISATAGGRTDTLSIRVRFPVATINLTPAAVTLAREGAQQLTATTIDTQGATVTGRTVTWSSSTPAVATVSATGLVSASATTANGTTTTITATVANASDGGTVITSTRLITVTGDPVVATVTVTGGSGFIGNAGTVALTATSRSGLGNPIAAPITWSTSAAGTATVDAAGLVTFAGGTGAVTITATAVGAGAGGADRSGTAVFEVATILVSGAPVALAQTASTGQSFAFSRTAAHDSLRVQIVAGGTGDADVIVVAPGVTNWVLNNSAGSGFVCVSWNAGNGESCAVPTPVVGWYRIYVWAFGGTDVSGTTITLTTFP